MRQPEGKRAITRDRCDAVLLDLDGVRDFLTSRGIELP
jgi:hypothetical protein